MNQVNSFVSFLIMVLLAAALQFFLPWWSLVFPCFLMSFLFGKSGFSSFVAGFFAIAILWIGTGLLIQTQTSSGLPQQISMLFPGKSIAVLYLLTGLTGGLTGGMSSLSGFLVRRIF